jgi:hypothetical protein
LLYFLNIDKCYSQVFTNTATSFKGVISDYSALIKDKTAKNSITMQPFGFLFLLSNIEYDRYISKSFSAGIKIQFTTFLLRKVIEKSLDKEKDKILLNSIKSEGFGVHIRYYTGGRSVEGFYLGLGADASFLSYDEMNDNKDLSNYIPPFPPPPPTSSTSLISHKKGTLWRTMFEIGNKINLSSGNHGVALDWSFGAGGSFFINENKVRVIPLVSLGFGIGYAF